MKTFRSPPWCFAFQNRKGGIKGSLYLDFLKYISGYKISKFCLGTVTTYSIGVQTASVTLRKMYLFYILEQFECSEYI